MSEALGLDDGLEHFTDVARTTRSKHGGNHEVATITLDQPNPALGDTVTFTYEGPNVPKLRIRVFAYGADLDGNGYADLMYGADQPADTSFLLGAMGSEWLSRGGPAHCQAQAYHWHANRWTLDAELEFDAGG